MRRLTALFAFIFSLALLAALPVAAQEIFTDNSVDYTLELPSENWRVIARPDSMHQHAEFVYGDRMDGYLQIRRESVEAGTTAEDLAERDRDQKLRFQPGFVAGKQEDFQGRLNGVTMSYEYTSGGKPMLGRIYYLQADSRTIYALRFTGQRDRLSRIRNQTDLIARSFRLK